MKTIQDIIDSLIALKEDKDWIIITDDWIKTMVIDDVDKIVEDIKEELSQYVK